MSQVGPSPRWQVLVGHGPRTLFKDFGIFSVYFFHVFKQTHV